MLYIVLQLAIKTPCAAVPLCRWAPPPPAWLDPLHLPVFLSLWSCTDIAACCCASVQVGGRPAWLDPLHLPSAEQLTCRVTGKPLEFLLQVRCSVLLCGCWVDVNVQVAAFGASRSRSCCRCVGTN